MTTRFGASGSSCERLPAVESTSREESFASMAGHSPAQVRVTVGNGAASVSGPRSPVSSPHSRPVNSSGPTHSSVCKSGLRRYSSERPASVATRTRISRAPRHRDRMQRDCKPSARAAMRRRRFTNRDFEQEMCAANTGKRVGGLRREGALTRPRTSFRARKVLPLPPEQPCDRRPVFACSRSSATPGASPYLSAGEGQRSNHFHARLAHSPPA
jgi:hypothetical protein